MTKEKRIEKMENELREAGHEGVWVYYGTCDGYCFAFGGGIEIADTDKHTAIQNAYRYFQQQQRNAAMAAFVAKIATIGKVDGTGSAYPTLLNVIAEAKGLMGEGGAE